MRKLLCGGGRRLEIGRVGHDLGPAIAEADDGAAMLEIESDGAEHLHVWFFARPAGVLQLRGSSLPDWLDVLPALPSERTQAIARFVADALQEG